MDDENKIKVYEPAVRALDRRSRELPASYEVVETEETPDLRAYWRIIRKRRWTILTIFFVFFTVVLLGTLKQTPIYRAQALIEIQRENPDIPSIKELFELEAVSDTYLETQYKVLQSESLAERVIDQLGLDKLDEFNRPKLFSSLLRKKKIPAPQTFTIGREITERDSDAYQNALERFRDRLEIEPAKRSRLVTVNFESQDANVATHVVSTLIENYIEQSLEARWNATQKASEWLSQQLAGMKANLEKSEDELQNYARTNNILFLETDKGNTENIVNARLRQLQEELTKAQAQRYEKESLQRLVQAGDYSSLPGVVENKLMQDLTVRLAELKRQYAQLATNFNPDYPKVKEIQSQIDEVEVILKRERDRAATGMTNDYIAAVRREGLVRQAFEEQQKQAGNVAEKSVQYNILMREVETNRHLYEALLQRLKEAGVSAGLRATNIRIVDPAKTPTKQARPDILFNLAMAVCLGLGLGVGAAFFQEHLDSALKSTDDVERHLRLPVLAVIPSAASLNGHRGGVYGLFDRGKTTNNGHKAATLLLPAGWHRIDSEGQQHSAMSEAFRGLRTSLLLSTPDRSPGSILVTSAQPSEGKTTIAANLAISLAQLAQQGQRVLLVDADMRRPDIHKLFDIQDGLGLVGYLAGHHDWRAAVHPTGLGGLEVLFCGPVPPNPAELLSSDRMRELIRQASAEYNFVVIDSAPVLNVADSRILATVVEGVVLVVHGGVTARELGQRAHGCVRDVGANLLGVVLNNVDPQLGDGYYHYYQEYRR